MQQQRSMEAEKQRSAEVLASFDAREAQAGTQLRDAETRVQTCRDALARLRTEAAEQEAQLAGQRTALTRTEAELSGEKTGARADAGAQMQTDAGLSSAADSIKRYECECERMQDELAEEKAAHERSETLAHTLREQLNRPESAVSRSRNGGLPCAGTHRTQASRSSAWSARPRVWKTAQDS